MRGRNLIPQAGSEKASFCTVAPHSTRRRTRGRPRALHLDHAGLPVTDTAAETVMGCKVWYKVSQSVPPPFLIFSPPLPRNQSVKFWTCSFMRLHVPLVQHPITVESGKLVRGQVTSAIRLLWGQSVSKRRQFQLVKRRLLRHWVVIVSSCFYFLNVFKISQRVFYRASDLILPLPTSKSTCRQFPK